MKKKNKKVSSPSTGSRPMQIQGPGDNEESSRELRIADLAFPVFSSPFRLPRGWSVEERRRINSPGHPGKVDKYYYEPGSGRKFRSLLSIEKYLRGEDDAIVPKRVNSGNPKIMQIMPCTTKSALLFGLPDHWIVQEIPRRNVNYAGTIDRFYIEPGTGQRFRSRIAAERYLQDVRNGKSTANAKRSDDLSMSLTYQVSTQTNNCGEDLPLRVIIKQQTDAKKIKVTSKAQKPANHSPVADNSGCSKKDVFKQEENASKHGCPTLTAKVKWVLGGPGGNTWNAFVGESIVPESVKQEWSESFIFSIYEQC